MNAETVLSTIYNVIDNNKDKIFLMAQTCGGWEIWLQCELAYLFSYDVQREVDVWGDGRACDLFFQEARYVVELKCLGWNVIQTSKKKEGSFGSTGFQQLFLKNGHSICPCLERGQGGVSLRRM